MAEQLICNQQVDGSTPFTSSNESAMADSNFGGFPERPKGADCKSVVTDFGGPNPPSPTKQKMQPTGCIFCLYGVFDADIGAGRRIYLPRGRCTVDFAVKV